MKVKALVLNLLLMLFIVSCNFDISKNSPLLIVDDNKQEESSTVTTGSRDGFIAIGDLSDLIPDIKIN